MDMLLANAVIDFLPEEDRVVVQAIRNEALILEGYLKFNELEIPDKEWVNTKLEQTRQKGNDIVRECLNNYRFASSNCSYCNTVTTVQINNASQKP